MNKIFINKPGNTTIVMVIVNTGAFNEIEKYKGISHFVEHMCFKGNPKRNQKQISSAIDDIGGVLNAFTDWEITAYWAKVGNPYRDLATDVITNLATKPLFPTREIDKEKEVIIQELKMYEDDAKYYVYQIFNKSLYETKSGFYLPIVGTKETLNNIKKDDLIKYHKDTYINPTLIIAGDIKNEKQIKCSYNGFHIPSELKDNPMDILIKQDTLTQANILIGNSIRISPEAMNKTEQMFCLLLLDAIYGDMSGRLFNSVREKNNLVYRIHFDWEFYNNGNIQWTVSAGLDKDKIEKARELIIIELKRPISKKDIEKALMKSIGIQEMELDNVKNIGNVIAYSLIRGVDYEKFIFEYKKNLKLATKSINDFIKEMKFENNILVGIVPKKGKENE